jgi:hypothetical protein
MTLIGGGAQHLPWPAMQCTNCGRELPEGATKCPHCGFEVETDPTVAYIPLADRLEHPLSPSEAAHLPGVHGWALVVERGPSAGMTFVLPSGLTTVGRHPESDIFLDDVTVSRQHCRLLLDNNELTVEDSGSTNGTYVNEERVDRASVAPGDVILIGRFHFIAARGDA